MLLTAVYGTSSRYVFLANQRLLVTLCKFCQLSSTFGKAVGYTILIFLFFDLPSPRTAYCTTVPVFPPLHIFFAALDNIHLNTPPPSLQVIPHLIPRPIFPPPVPNSNQNLPPHHTPPSPSVQAATLPPNGSSTPRYRSGSVGEPRIPRLHHPCQQGPTSARNIP